MSTERTLAILKPDVVGIPWLEKKKVEDEEGEMVEKMVVRAPDMSDLVVARAEREGFRIVRRKRTRITKALARELYRNHADAAYVDAASDFLCSGPVEVLLLEREDAIRKWREVLGPEDPAEARQVAQAAAPDAAGPPGAQRGGADAATGGDGEEGDGEGDGEEEDTAAAADGSGSGSGPSDEALQRWPLRALFGSSRVRNVAHGSDSKYNAMREARLLFPEPQRLQRTLAMLKPDVVGAGRAEEVVKRIEEQGFLVLARTQQRLTEDRARAFYAEHEGKPFLPQLLQFMTSDPVVALVLERVDAVAEWRMLMGPTATADAKRDAPHSLRAKFGTDGTRNAVHGSDSEASAAREIAFFFPEPLPLQRTLALVKPGAAEEHAEAIEREMAAHGFTVLARQRVTLSAERAQRFYAEHRGKPFFEALVAYMSSGPVLALVLTKPAAVRAWRLLCGPTNPAVARERQPLSIRARFATDGTRNAVHGSDSEASAAREIAFFFPHLTKAAVPTGQEARAYLEALPATGAAPADPAPTAAPRVLTDVLVEGLTALCREKPRGLEAVEWLGRWLITHNPAKPHAPAPPSFIQARRTAAAAAAASDAAAAAAAGAEAVSPSAGALPNGGARVEADAADASAEGADAPAVVLALGAVEGEEGSAAALRADALAQLAERFNMALLSMPDLLQAAQAQGTSTAQAVRAALAAGEPVPVEAAVAVAKRAIKRAAASRVLLTGFATSLDRVFALEQQAGECRFMLHLRAEGERKAEDAGTAAEAAAAAEVAEFYAKLGRVRHVPLTAGAGASAAALREAAGVVADAAPFFQPRVVFVLGGPGSGKGTQCERIAREFGYQHLSLSALLRAEAARGSKDGALLQRAAREGQVVPLEVTLRVLRRAVDRSAHDRFLLHGFPRTVEEAVAVERALGAPAMALHLDCPPDELRRRLLRRGGPEDDAARADKRVRAYLRDTVPLLQLYLQSGLLRTVSALPPAEAVFAEVRQLLKPRVVFVLGGPGSGKGTQCERIAREFGYQHLSAGDLLRAEVARGSRDGEQIDAMIRQGQIVPLHITLALLRAAIRNSAGSLFLVDGFPRALEQASGFEAAVGECDFVLFFDCPDAELTRRLLRRGETSGRSDDNAEAVAKRLQVFHFQSMPVIDHYARRGKVRTVSALPPPDEVFAAVQPLFKPRVVFALGGPGSGKGTQCERIKSEFGYQHLSVGDLLRAEVARGSPLGDSLRATMEQGQMVSDALAMSLLRRAMAAAGASRFLIDGFPRTLAQAEAFEREVARSDAVLFFDCPPDEMRRRLMQRGKTSGRADDNAGSIEKRLRTYVRETEPVLEWYAQQARLHRIDATPAPDTVFRHVRKLLQPSLVLLVGAAGSGRGTLATHLGRQLGFARIRVTELLAAVAQYDTPQGREVRRCLASHSTAPLEIVLPLLRRAMQRSGATRFLLDGFPRLVSDGYPLVHDQLHELEEQVAPVHTLLYLRASTEQRVLRANGDAEAVAAASETFLREKLPVVRHLEALGRAHTLNADAPADQVAAQALAVLREA